MKKMYFTNSKNFFTTTTLNNLFKRFYDALNETIFSEGLPAGIPFAGCRRAKGKGQGMHGLDEMHGSEDSSLRSE